MYCEIRELITYVNKTDFWRSSFIPARANTSVDARRDATHNTGGLECMKLIVIQSKEKGKENYQGLMKEEEKKTRQ